MATVASGEESEDVISCESDDEVDCITGPNSVSSSSGETGSCASGSASGSSRPTPVVSLLQRLKAPTPAEIARKRKTKSNPPPKGKRSCRGWSASDPKGISPSDRVKEFPNQDLKVARGKLFYVACREELSLKRSIIRNHVQSQKHVAGKASLKQKVGREQDIADALEKHNNEEHMWRDTASAAASL